MFNMANLSNHLRFQKYYAYKFVVRFLQMFVVHRMC